MINKTLKKIFETIFFEKVIQKSKTAASTIVKRLMKEYKVTKRDITPSALYQRYTRYIQSHAEELKQKFRKVKKISGAKELKDPEDFRKINMKNYETKILKQRLSSMKKEMAIIDNIYEKFLLAQDIREPVKLELRIPKGPDCQTMVVNVGDTHIGKEILPLESGGLAEYSLKIFEQRLELYLALIVEKFELHNSNRPIEKIVINFLGDIIDNDIIYEGHQNYVEVDTMTQVLKAIDYFDFFLATLLKKLKVPIELHCAYGNHGRPGKKGKQKHHVNFDFLIYKMLERSYKNDPNISFSVPLVWFDTYSIYGKNILILHGDDIKSWMSIPFYGLERAQRRYTEMLQEFFLATIVGHFHQGAEMSINTGEIIINGSFDGGDLFSMKVLNKMSSASQCIFGITSEGFISWRYKLILR